MASGAEQLVGLSFLDELVKHYLKAPEGGGANAALAETMKALVLAGHSHGALEALSQHPAGAVLLDDRLRFKLQKQRFLDLVESGDPEQLKQALELSKLELAPLALHAYPEAYQEFKHTMLRLLYPSPGAAGGAAGAPTRGAASTVLSAVGAAEEAVRGQQPRQQGPVLSRLAAVESVHDSRRQLAKVLFRTVREALGVADPPFTVLLRYLLLVHGQHAQQGQQALPMRAGAFSVRRSGANGETAKEHQSIEAGSSREAWGMGLGSVTAQLARGNLPVALASSRPLPPGGGAAPEMGSGAAGAGEDIDAQCRSLLLPGQDPMPLPPQGAEGAVTCFPEAQVQALRNSLGCDREEAIALMRQAGGNASKALRSMVQARRLDDAAVLQLVQNYAVFRGLDVTLPNSGQAKPAAEPDSVAPMDIAESGSSPQQQQPGAAAAAEPGGPGAPADTAWEAAFSGFAPPAKVARSGGRRSPSDPSVKSAQQAAAAAAKSLQTRGGDERLLTSVDSIMRTSLPAGSGGAAAQVALQQQKQQWLQGREVEEHAGQPLCFPAAAAGGSSEWEAASIARELRGMLEQGLSDEVEQRLEACCPGLCDRYPDMTFQVRRCRFLALATSSSPATALAFVRSRLSPLIQAHARLQPQLKACVSALMLPNVALQMAAVTGPGTSVVSSAGSNTGLGSRTLEQVPEGQGVEGLQEAAAKAAAAVHHALRQQHNIQEPCLLRLLGHLLVSHSTHFMAQRCKDSFEQEMGVPQLRGPGLLAAAEQLWRATRQSRGLPPTVPTSVWLTSEARATAQDAGLLGAMAADFFHQPLRPGEGGPSGLPLFQDLAGGVGGGGTVAAGQEEQSEEGAHVMSESEGEEEDEEGTEGLSEEAILLTQEFSGMPRGQAIELLMLFGSPQAVMAHLFP